MFSFLLIVYAHVICLNPSLVEEKAMALTPPGWIIFIHYLSLTSPLQVPFVIHASRTLQSHDLFGEGINFGSHNTFLTTEGHRGPPRMWATNV